MKKLEIVAVVMILIGAFFVRLYRFNNPVGDWHSWRQADTSAVSRNFVKYGFDFLHPRMDNISNVQSGFENPQGYFFAEFPLFNALQAGGYVLFGHVTLEEWGRLVSILSSVCSTLFIYLLVKRHGSKTAAFASACFFAFIPYSIYYGRTILPDSLGMAFLLSGIYTHDMWITSLKAKKPSRFLLSVVACVLAACSLLVRPFVVFYLPVFLWIVWRAFGVGFVKKWQLYVLALLVVIPFLSWRWWLGHYPEGIPANSWLFNEGNIRFTGAYFYWLFAERIGRIILGYWGVVFLVFGLLWKGKREWGFYVALLISMLAYLVVIARGNVQHDYYQYIVFPCIAMCLGRGVDALVSLPKEVTNRAVSYTIIAVCGLFCLMFGWYYVRDYFNINNPTMIEAGRAVDALTPKNAKVLAPLDGDSSFLYQTNRFGWASYEHSLPELIKLGATNLVLLHPNSGDIALSKHYHVVASTSGYIIFDLTKKP